jgi:hypothetical protein
MTTSREPLITVELVPGALWVDVNDVELPPPLNARAWLLATRGLVAVGQQEMLLAVRRRPGDTRPPEFPFVLFRTVHQLAASGATVKTGGFTQLCEPIAPRSSIAGFCYQASSYHLSEAAGITDPGVEPLLAVPLLTGEIDVAVRFGASRVLALLGAEYRYFPYPWWFDPGRGPVVDAAQYFNATRLRHTAIVHVPELEVTQFGTRLEIALPLSRCGWLHQLVEGVAEPLSLLCALNRDSPTRLVWRPGQDRPVAIYSPSSDAIPGDHPISGNFCMFLHGDLDPGVQPVEDGFAIMLSEEQWAATLVAMKNGQPLRWENSGARGVREVMIHFPADEYLSRAARHQRDLGHPRRTADAPVSRGAGRECGRGGGVRGDPLSELRRQRGLRYGQPNMIAAVSLRHEYQQVA